MKSLACLGNRWWNFNLAPQKGEEREVLESAIVLANRSIYDQQLYDKLLLLFTHLGGDISQITRAFAVDNVLLKSNFEGFRETLTNKHKDSPSLFKKDEWRMKENWKQRKSFILHLNEKIAKFRNLLGNDGTKVL